MTTQQNDALQCAADLEYSIARHGMQDAFTLNAYKAMKMVRTQHARITELESQLAQRFDAEDMATAAAQGFRDGVAAPQPAGAAGWQSIETAPKDGSRILLHPAVEVADDWSKGHWNSEHQCWIVGGSPSGVVHTAWHHLPAAPGPADGESNG